MSRTLHCQEDITKVFSTKCTRRVSLSGWFGNDIGWASSDFSCYTSFFTKMYSIPDRMRSMSRTLHCGERFVDEFSTKCIGWVSTHLRLGSTLAESDWPWILLCHLYLHQKVLDSRSGTINVKSIALPRRYYKSLLDHIYRESKSLWVIREWHWLSVTSFFTKMYTLAECHIFFHQNVLDSRSETIKVENVELKWRHITSFLD